jgi:hypothetical protein
MASRVASKSSRWLKDPSTYPLFACIGAGAVLCLSVGVRHLTTSPDVKWNREVRKNPELALQIDQKRKELSQKHYVDFMDEEKMTSNTKPTHDLEDDFM